MHLRHRAGLVAARVGDGPGDLDGGVVGCRGRHLDQAGHGEVGAGRIVLDAFAVLRQLLAHHPPQRAVAVAGRADDLQHGHPRRPVQQAVRVAHLAACLDAGQHRRDRGRGGVGHLLQRRRRTLDPGGGVDRRAGDAAADLAHRVDDGEARHHLAVLPLRRERQAPVAGMRLDAERRHFEVGQRCRDVAGEPVAGCVDQQRPVGRVDREAGRRRLRQLASGAPDVALERPRQVAAGRQQRDQGQQHRHGAAPRRVRRPHRPPPRSASAA